MILFDASNAQTASRWKSDSLLSQPQKGHASRDGFRSGQAVAADDGFVASPILSRANSSLASKRAEVSDAELVVKAPAPDTKPVQGGSSAPFRSDPLLHRQPDAASTGSQPEDGSSDTATLETAASETTTPETAESVNLPGTASADEAEATADEALADAAAALAHQQPDASHDASADTSDDASADVSAEAQHSAADASVDKAAEEQMETLSADADEALAESSTALPQEPASSAAAVPVGHRLVSEQVLAGAMARERAMGRQQGMAEGRAAASTSAEEEVQQLRSVLRGLQASLSDTQRLFEPMQRLALHLAEQLVRGELEFSSRAIRRLIESALLEVDQKLAFSVRLNPEDLQLLRTTLGEDDAMHMAGDPSLSRGSVRVEMDDGVVEDLIENRLDTLARSLLGPEVKPHASVLSRASLHHAPSAMPASVAAAGSHHAAQPAAHAMPAMPSHNTGVEPGLARQDWTPPFARHEVSDIEPVAAVEPVHGYPYGD